MIPHSRPWLTASDAAAVADVLNSEMIAQGARVATLENKIAEWVGVSGAGVGVASGAAAIVLALEALEIGAGDGVVVPTYVCSSVMEAVRSVGAVPVLCDVGHNWVVTPSEVQAVLDARCRAVIVPHLYGIFCDTVAFRKLGVTVIEDFAQALGPRRDTLLHGDVGVFSFHPTKCLTAGEGGVVVGRDPSVVRRARYLRDGDSNGYGRRFFAPLSDLAAALALNQLEQYDAMLERRNVLAHRYLHALKEWIAPSDAEFLTKRSMFFRFPLRVEGGLTACESYFASAGVTVRRGVDRLLHRLVGLSDERYPVATNLFASTVSLPIYPALKDPEHDRCIDVARTLFAAGTIRPAGPAPAPPRSSHPPAFSSAIR